MTNCNESTFVFFFRNEGLDLLTAGQRPHNILNLLIYHAVNAAGLLGKGLGAVVQRLCTVCQLTGLAVQLANDIFQGSSVPVQRVHTVVQSRRTRSSTVHAIRTPTIEYNIFLHIRSDPAGLNILAFSRYITD